MLSKTGRGDPVEGVPVACRDPADAECGGSWGWVGSPSIRRPGRDFALWLALILGIVLAAGSVGAAELLPAGRYRQHGWKREHGLPSDTVRAIRQGRDGYLWIGTESGLARFDGRQFTVFNHRNIPSFTHDRITALAEDSGRRIWIGTRDGVFWMEDGQIRRAALEGIPTNQPVSALLADATGAVWIATWHAVLEYRNGQTRVAMARPESTKPTCSFLALLEDRVGGIWTGTLNGAWHLPAGSREFIRVPGLEIVHGLARSAEGIWLQGEDLARLEHGRFSQVLSGRDQEHRHGVNLGPAILPDRRQHLWMGGEHEGLFLLDSNRLFRFPLPASDPPIRVLALWEDDQGHIWVGTENHGLLCLRPQPLSTLGARDGLPNENIQAVLPTLAGGLWVGLEKGIRHWHDDRFEAPQWAAFFDALRVRALHEDAQGVLWIATDRSIERVVRGQVVPFPAVPGARMDKVWSIATDAAGNTWAGCVNGLLHWRDGTARFFDHTNGLPHRDSRDVRVVHVDRAGRVWLATAGGGLAWFRPGTNAAGGVVPGLMTMITMAQGLADDVVRALCEDANGVIWAGTEQGLHRVALEGDGGAARVHRFTIRDGLPDGRVNGLVTDDLGHLWINGVRGLTRARVSELNAVADGKAARADLVTYDETDGMPTIETSGFRSHPASGRTPDGELWFATPRGLVRVNPRELPEASPPEPRLERIVADGRPSGPSGLVGVLALNLPPGGLKSLELHFTAPEFRAPEKLRFQYRLEGIDTDWVDAGARREVTYTNLKPGRYRFEVMAARQHGLWSRAPAAFAFVLTPLPWQTWWFWTLIGAAAAGLLALAVRWRFVQARQLHALEQEAGLMRERARIARDMHDDIGARLGQLSLLVESGQAGEASGQRATLREVVRETAASLDATVWAVQPGQDTLRHLADYLADHAQEFLRAAALELELDYPGELPSWPLPADQRRQLFLAAKEALHNVVRHAAARKVTLRLVLREAAFDLEIADDGCGLPAGLCENPQSSGPGHDGLRNLHRRAEAAGATLRIESAPGRGTRLVFTVPCLPARPGRGR